jgi:hypothetical protein
MLDDIGYLPNMLLREQVQHGLSLANVEKLRLHHIAEAEYPEEPFSSRRVEAWIHRMETALECGSLRLSPGETYSPYSGFPYIPRENYRAWRSTQTDPLVGSYIRAWIGATPEPSPQKSTAVPVHGNKAPSREIALVEAENEALLTLRKELKREPDFEEFWDYLTHRDETGTVADYTDDRLMWTGKNGNNCETTKATLRNRLTAAKRRNPFFVNRENSRL